MKKLFNNRQEAERVAKQRNEQVYLLGQKHGVRYYFVGKYNDAIKKTRLSMP